MLTITLKNKRFQGVSQLLVAGSYQQISENSNLKANNVTNQQRTSYIYQLRSIFLFIFLSLKTYTYDSLVQMLFPS